MIRRSIPVVLEIMFLLLLVVNVPEALGYITIYDITTDPALTVDGRAGDDDYHKTNPPETDIPLYGEADDSGGIAHASSTADLFSVQVEAWGAGGTFDAYAETKYLFEVEEEVFKLEFAGTLETGNAGFESSAGFSFWDMTENTEIDSYEWLSFIHWDENYSVDLSHQYQLTFYAKIDPDSEGGEYSSVLFAVPEPATLLLLGFGGFVLLKKRRID